MKVRGPAGLGGAEPVRGVSSTPRAKPDAGVKPASAASKTDSVQISQMAKFLDQISRLPDIRQEKVDAVRRELSKGKYVTQEKIDKAIENLMKELD